MNMRKIAFFLIGIANVIFTTVITDSLDLEAECDANITAQFKQQDISFDCNNGVIIVKNIIEELSVSLILTNYMATNAHVSFIDISVLSLEIELTELTLKQVQQIPFISIVNVADLTIKNFTVSSQKYEDSLFVPQILSCSEISSLTLENVQLFNNSVNYMLNMSEPSIQLSSKTLQIDSLLFDSYEGSVQLSSSELLNITDIQLTSSVKEDINLLLSIDCYICQIDSISLEKENTSNKNIIINTFEFQVQQSLIIENVSVNLDQNCTIFDYSWTFNNSTSEIPPNQTAQFIQINQLNISSANYLNNSKMIGEIQFTAKDLNTFTVQNAQLKEVHYGDISFSFKDVRQANFSNVDIVNCTSISQLFQLTRSSLISFVNITADYNSLKKMDQLMILSAFTSLMMTSLKLPTDPDTGTENNEDRTENPLMSFLSGDSVTLNDCSFNLKNVPFTLALFTDISSFTTMNSVFENIYSSKNSNGGCLNFGNSNSISLKLISTRFDTCISTQFGGAIFGGILNKAQDVVISNCKSELGGGLFLSNKSNLLQIANIFFSNNYATFYAHDYLLGFKSINITSIYEYNQNLGGTDLYFKQVYSNSNYTYEMYSGLLYIVYFKIVLNNVEQKVLDIPINLYSFCQFELNSQQNFQQFEIPIVSDLPYMVLYQNPANFITNQKINIKFADTFSISQNFTIPQNFCAKGMEVIQLVNKEYMCKYCDATRANYNYSILINIDFLMHENHNNNLNKQLVYSGRDFNELSFNNYDSIKKLIEQQQYSLQDFNRLTDLFAKQATQCQYCNVNLFEQCYANYSNLKSGYWRSDFTVNDSQIYLCGIQQDNCQGGNLTGNFLCNEGYIGPQCLDCDRRGVFWNETFGESGTFQCNKCGDSKSNTVKIVIAIVAFYLIISVLIYSNFRSLCNILYANYLSKMNMIFIGSSVQFQGETSVLIKILMFNFSIYQVSNFISQKNILDYLSFMSSNPLSTQFISLDCFLINKLPSDYNIGFTRLILCILIPSIALTSILIFLLICWIFKKVSLQMLLNVCIMAYTYLFVFTFYSTTLEYSLESFKCIQLEINESYLMLDLSLSCQNHTSSFTKIKTAGIFIFVFFCVLSPSILFLMYFLQRNKLNTVKVLIKFGFFYREYKKKFYFWEFIRQLLKIAIVSIKVLFIDSSVILVTLYSICLIIYLGLFFICQPFLTMKFNRLEVMTIIVAIINILSSSLLRQSKQNSNTIQNQQQQFVQIFYYVSQAIQFIYFSYLLFLIVISFFQNKIKRLQKYRYLSFLSKYFPIYPHRLFLNFKKLRTLVLSKSYDNAYNEQQENEQVHLLSSNIQMQDVHHVTQNKNENETIAESDS